MANAAVFRQVNRPMEIEEIDIAKPGPREVLVRTKAAGVCHSDLHFYNGTYPSRPPMVLGHESAGIVEEVGSDVSYVKAGDHVITCLSVFCGHCEYCLTGHMSLCQSSETRRGSEQEPRLSQAGSSLVQFADLGSFCELMLVHEHSIAKIRDDMPMDRAALIGCGVTTGIGAVIHTAGVEPGATVAVIGCGGVGLSCVNGAAIAGAGRIIAIDRIASKLELAKTFGATDCVNASESDPVQAVRDLTDGGVHYSFEAIGLKIAAEQAFRMLRAGGTATVIGMIPPGEMVSLHGPDFLQEKALQGSMMGSNRFRVDMPRFVDFYMQGSLHLDDLVSRRIKIEDVNDALAQLETGEEARSVIVFD
ncbi:MAG: Zn-dependent alcohol dehydrogenase [Gammaproteobacteria bacterium]|nr:Zn-dependent alcohol dehydrogenase [Gammaproteobacteria bacterium]